MTLINYTIIRRRALGLAFKVMLKITESKLELY